MTENIPEDMIPYIKNEKAIGTNRFKIKLFEYSIKEKRCERCKLDKWLDGDIPLELHHIDGNSYNNNLSNIEILCPNCHTLTPNFRGKNKKNFSQSVEEIQQIVSSCESINQVLIKLGYTPNASTYNKIRNFIKKHDIYLKPKEIKEKRCDDGISKARATAWIKSRKVERPSKEELLELVWSKSILMISNELGISDNAIRKWATSYSIPVPPVGYWAKYHSGKIEECEEIKRYTMRDYIPKSYS